MTAEIIDLWLARRKLPQRKPKICMYDPQARDLLIDRDCACKACKDFFAGMQRSTQEIMRDIMKLRINSKQDEAFLTVLTQELHDNSNPYFW